MYIIFCKFLFYFTTLIFNGCDLQCDFTDDFWEEKRNGKKKAKIKK